MTTVTIEGAVEKRAYELFMERGGAHGNDQDDWFNAENELKTNTRTRRKRKQSGKTASAGK